jgi:hypothetical protein
MQEISSLAEKRLSSAEGLCSVQYVTHIIPNSGTSKVAMLVLWMAREQHFEAAFDECR